MYMGEDLEEQELPEPDEPEDERLVRGGPLRVVLPNM